MLFNPLPFKAFITGSYLAYLGVIIYVLRNEVVMIHMSFNMTLRTLLCYSFTVHDILNVDMSLALMWSLHSTRIYVKGTL